MKVSLALVSLGLCIAPAFAQSIATLDLKSEKEEWPEHPESGECIRNWTPEVPLEKIDIDAKVPGTKCIFYTEEGCTGQSLVLKPGKHEFVRDFFVGSFLCVD